MPTVNDTVNEPTETFGLSVGGVSATGTITDNDDPPTVSINDVTVNEGAGTATFTVTLSAASGQTVSVNYGTSNGTATSGADYTAASGSLIFNPGVTSQTITVPITNDAIYEGSETFNVTLTAPTNATIATPTGVGTIRDDGTGGPPGTDNDTPILSVSSPVVEEIGGFAVFTVSLSNQSTQATTLSLALANGTATGGGGDYGSTTETNLQVSTDGGATWVNAASVTIPALQTSVLVRTPITNDTLVEGNERFTLTATRTAGTPLTNVGGAATGTATIMDNDTFSVSAITVDDDDVNENRDAVGSNDILHTGTISNVASSVVLSINDGAASGLTSNGQAITYSWNAATRTLTASTPSATAFTVTLDANNSSYTYKQFLAIDHTAVAGEAHSLNIPLTLMARDSGGSLITSSPLNITVFDDAPTVSADKTILTDNDGSHSETGFLTQATLSNDITHVSWDTTGLPNLVFEGKAVQYVDNGNGTLTGQLADGTVIFRVAINPSVVDSNNSPQYTFELLNTLGRLGVAGSENSYTVISGGNNNNLDLGFGGFLIDKMTAVAGATTATINTNNGWIGVGGNWFDPGDKLFMNFVDPSGQAGQVTGLNMLVEGQGSAAYTLNWTVTAAIDAVGNTVTYSGSTSGAGNADVPFTIPLQNGALYFTNLEVSSPAGSGDFRISFSTISANNYFSDISLPLSYTLTDSDSDTASGAFNITLDTNAPPVIDLDANDSSGATGTSYHATYTENGAGIAIADADALINDADSSTLANATVRLTNAQAGDVLAVGALPSGITASINTSVAGQITVTLTGASSLADYQTAIRAITYRNTGDDPSTVDRNIDVTVNDGKASASASTTITVVAVNDPPVNTVPGAQTTAEDSARVFSTANGNAITVSDPDASSLTTTLTAANGILTLGSTAGVTVTGNGTATVTVSGSSSAINTALNGTAFTPATDYSGNAQFTVSTSDGTATDVDTVNITVTPVADMPTVYAHLSSNGMIASASNNLFTADFNSGGLTGWTGNALFGNSFAEIPGGTGKGSSEAALFNSVAWSGQTGSNTNEEANFSARWAVRTNSGESANGTPFAVYNQGGGSGSDDAQGFLQYTGSALTTAEKTSTSYVINTQIYADANSAQANGVGFVFGYQNDSNYFLARWENPSPDYATGGSLFNSYPGQYQELSLVQIVGGVPIDLARAVFNGDDWFSLRIAVSDTGIAVTAVDLTSAVTTSLNYSYGSVTGGATTAPPLREVGFYSFDNDSAVRFDSLTINAGVYSYTMKTIANLSDTDGSETLSAITLTGLPSGVTLTNVTTGTAIAVSGGTATVPRGDDMTMLSPTPLTNAQINGMTASVTATETVGGSTATNSSSVKLDVLGTSSADTLNGGTGDDWISGGAGNDALSGGNGNDVLIGGAGNDTLTGGLGADVFKWELSDRGTAGSPAIDTVTDFDSAVNSDKLDLRDLLLGESHAGTDPGNLTDYLHFEVSGSNTVIQISSTGGFSGGYSAGATDQRIVLNNTDLTGGGTLSADQQIIQDLLSKGKLITD
ncbi:MAG: Calx-beta domain-containing protein [Thiobacillus sp.]|nr:Calx-beta domain-containing protein [Thiobacillus sp.]